MTSSKKISPMARVGNRNAAKPASERRVRLAGQSVDRATLAALRARKRTYKSIGRAIDAAVQALIALERSVGVARENYDGASAKNLSASALVANPR